MVEQLSEILTPIAICVVLPVLVVWLTSRRSINNDNRRAEVLLKAIEANNNIDADKLAEAFAKPRMSAREILNARLLRGCIYTLLSIPFGVAALISPPQLLSMLCMCGLASLAVGVSYLIVYFVTRKQVNGPTKED